MSKGKLFLIDGHALIFRMYYAFLRRPMINSKGMDTSILFGFTKYLLELIDREKPTHIAVSFDPPGGTFRNEMYPEYKANRSETPQLVIDALEPLTQICQALDIPVLMIRGYEADDVIGTVAKRSAREGFEVYMVTPDKDYGQLIEENIFQYKPGKGGDESEIVGVQKVCERYGIQSPLQVIDMLTLCGDSADNVPGVNGVGEVGAGKLIGKYGSVENIYAHLDELSAKQKEKFDLAQPHIALSKQLVTIKTDVPLELESDQMRLSAGFTPKVAELFDLYEFGSLRRVMKAVAEISGSAAIPETAQQPSAALEYRSVSASQICALARKDGSVAVVVEGADAMALSAGGAVASGSVADFAALLEDPAICKIGASLKSQARKLASDGVKLAGRFLDIELMHYLLNPERSHKLESLAKTYLGVDLEQQQPVAREASLFGDDDSADDSAQERSALMEKTAVALCLLSEKLLSEMESAGLSSLYDDIEEPLSHVLLQMELDGVKVDLDSLKDFASHLRSQVVALEAQVRELAGEPSLNVSSPKQIGEVIFEKMKLDPKAKKSAKGSWSTDEDTLLELADKSPIIDAILDYRGTKKLLSTYIEPFPGYISATDGRVHTTFNQALTATGRLSSSNPNLQNIPIRTEQGREIRKAFVPQETRSVIMSADYSQIELRIMAHLSCDAHLVQAFRDGVDVHAATASKIFGVPVEEVTADQRRIAKTANFGIMYGISAFGLSQRLRCSRSEAKQIIEDYFASFPSIRSFIDDTLAAARETSYVETLFGRRRYIPDITSHNATVRALAERNAVNAPIQGTSADIIKIAMIRVASRLSSEGLKARMVLQIHDELVFEVPLSEVEAVQRIVKEEMEHVMELSVPLTVECNYGRNWLEAH